ncbi:MAG TPA: glycosyltransferase family 2 protein [Anaerolineae bacterium]
MMNAPLPLAVIIPAHNAAKTIAQCLTSVYQSDTAPAQVIIVDDGSTDCSAQIAAAFSCEIIRNPRRRGAAAARNTGAWAARSEILFFLDADILVPAHALRRMAEILKERPDLSAVFGSYQKETLPTNFVSIYKNLLHHYTHQTSAPEAATFCGGFGAVRGSVFRELGGFDETQRALEDVEFGYRMYRAGHRILLDKTLQFTHTKRYTLFSLIKSDVFNRSIPWTKLMLRQRIFRNDLNTKTNNILSVVLAGLIACMFPLAAVTPAGVVGLIGAAIPFVILNAPFYGFVLKERGLLFMLETIVMNWFTYLYSGIGFVLGLLEYSVEGSQKWLARHARPT